MMQDNRLHTGTHLVTGFLVATVWILAGCATNPPLQADGLPGEQYLVGGGVMIDWEAPAAGTAYLVEKTAAKIVETRSLQKGDSYTFSVSSGGQAAEFERMLGVKFSEARFLLYFQPAGTTGPTP